MMKYTLFFLGVLEVAHGLDERQLQETVPSGGICSTMIPPSPLPPDNSNCWQWYTPPPTGIVPPGAPPPPVGCMYTPCQDAVCECDPYCCDTAWDLSCRGYYMKAGDSLENNYFVHGCSAKILCCEPESAYPDPPVGGANPPIISENLPITTTFTNTNLKVNVIDSWYQKDEIVTTSQNQVVYVTSGKSGKKGGKRQRR